MHAENVMDLGLQSMGFLERMYEQYLENPHALEPSWKVFFDRMDMLEAKSGAVPVFCEKEMESHAELRIYHLIQAYRTYGHLMARIDPIATRPLEEPWQLQLQTLGFTRKELAQSFPTCGLFDSPEASLQEIIDALREIYSSNIGIEYMGVQDQRLEQWLQRHIEPNRCKVQLTIEQKKMILQYLNKSELLEKFLHTKYAGQKRFSLEGAETLIPILAAIIEKGADLGIGEFVVGMAHRGRLNVLSNILDKSYSQIFSEFEEGYIPLSFEGSGDVKYHKGFSSIVRTANGREARIVLASNPSHLEAVNPVVQGMVRARQVQQGDERKECIIPVLIHGDAAISGQGVVYETLQLYKLQGYSTGGTVHIIINNRIGFTTLPEEGRSTRYCSAIAQSFQAPVFHVNAEDPESCIYATYLAIQIRQKFHCDVFIDLNCYRKFGHNEADEPAFTQPLEYQLIRTKKPIREIYRDDLIHQGVVERQMANSLEQEFKAALQNALSKVKPKKEPSSKRAVQKKFDIFEPVETGVPIETLQEIGRRYCHIPKDLIVHKKLARLIQDRLAMTYNQKPVDWGMGETLAYASLLWEGVDVRLSGQDSCRGTFSHRHALWVDQTSEKRYYPLQHLKQNQGRFDVLNSPLSEFGVLGFEYGYSLAHLKALVIWEAQFGDFCNGAQIIIDQFIATAEMKWGQKNGIVLLLPHGYEGQGPEHSSARMERFLILCGNDNMLLANPTTPVQFFHLLRRHMVKPMEKPLIIFTPKGLLRHPECVSPLDAFVKGGFEEVLDDPVPPTQAKRLVFCSGRIFYDLIAERKKRDIEDMAIVRIEQLYPLHREKIRTLIEKYKTAEEVYWVQEEPKNMGAWSFIRPILRQLLPGKSFPKYAGRSRSASPAAGSFALHKKEHAALMATVFGG